MSAEDEVRSASERFYLALNRMLDGDAGPMNEIWLHSDTVTTMNPVGGREVGWQSVGNFWLRASKLFSNGHVELRDQLIQVTGDMAYEVGVETGQATLAGRQVPVEHRVTNVYRRQAGGWKMVHHHTDLSQAMQEIARDPQAAGR